MVIKWETSSASADSSKAHRRLEEGWEPFGVTFAHGRGHTMWFRREVIPAELQGYQYIQMPESE